MGKTRFQHIPFSLLCALGLALFAPALLAADGMAVIKGRIVDEDGKPLKDVDVRMRQASMVTKEDGRFCIKVAPGPVIPSFQPLFRSGWQSLRVKREMGLVFLKPETEQDVGDIVYQRVGCRLKGLLTNERKEPLKGARLYFLTHKGECLAKGTTSEAGMYDIRLPKASRDHDYFVIRVRDKKGQCLGGIRIDGLTMWEENSADGSFCTDCGIISGKATYDGKPVAKAKLVLRQPDQKDIHTRYPLITVDERGSFNSKRIPKGTYEVFLTGEGLPRTSMLVTCPSENLSLNFPKAETGEVIGHLKITIQGRVAVPVEVQEGKEGLQHVFLADQDGKLAFPMIPVGECRWQKDKWVFHVKNIPVGEHSFQVLSAQFHVQSFDHIDGQEDYVIEMGHVFPLHEGFYVPRMSPPPSEIAKSLKVEIEANGVKSVEYEKDFTMDDLKNAEFE